VALLADALLADADEFVRAAQHAGRGAAQLDEIFADRLQIEHRVEGRDFQHADIGHAEQVGDLLDRLLGQPVIMLLLRLPQGRDHGGSLAAGRIFGDLRVEPGAVFRRELEALGLFFGETADAHDDCFPLEPRKS
jgi:hypothetical protein